MAPLYRHLVTPLFAILLLFVALQRLHADVDGYLGVNTSVSQWQMGFASGKSVNLIGQQWQSNKPDPLLYMVGISAAVVVNRRWSFTYQGEMGYAKANLVYTGAAGQNGQATGTLDRTPEIYRTDHSLAVSRILGASGFSVYAGAKLQAFRYAGSGNNVVTKDGVLINITPYPHDVTTIANYGPAIGVTYQFPISARVFGAVQTGFVYFPGVYDSQLTAELNTPNYQKFSARETFYGIGVTGLVSIIIRLTNSITLQVAARGQFYRTKTLQSVLISDQGFPSATYPNGTRDVPGRFDDTQDILLGGQVSLIYKVF